MPVPLKPPPTSLNEGVFAAPGHEEDDLVRAARSALRQGREAAEKAHRIAEARLDDQLLTEAARHRRARDDVYKVTRPALETLQATTRRFQDRIATLTEFLRGPPPTGLAPLLLTEIRTALAGMPREERRTTILASLGDRAVATAVLRCPPFLAALSPEEQEDFRLAWQRAEHPGEVDQLATLGKVLEHVERGGTLLLSYGVSLTNSRIIERAEQIERRAEEAVSAAVH